jgi:hypothetical protein
LTAAAEPPDSFARLAPRIDKSVLQAALRAWDNAQRRGITVRLPYLTVIDYSRPSTEPRLWTFDMRERRLLFEELVSHGKNTGDNLARDFSNKPGSLKSPLGVFVTGESYTGRNGLSMKLRGLEPGWNDKSEERAIVLHGADYVGPAVAQRMGRLGRSWGCPAVRREAAKRIIETLRGGSIVVSYYPDPVWLRTSALLAD